MTANHAQKNAVYVSVFHFYEFLQCDKTSIQHRTSHKIAILGNKHFTCLTGLRSVARIEHIYIIYIWPLSRERS